MTKVVYDGRTIHEEKILRVIHESQITFAFANNYSNEESAMYRRTIQKETYMDRKTLKRWVISYI